ncbi:unnamed protein product [Amoebophrya sp. A25]|nr:unnamed protein product [Amoebophrya sp. A25]|eukprot:GSA25T00027669001.1
MRTIRRKASTWRLPRVRWRTNPARLCAAASCCRRTAIWPWVATRKSTRCPTVNSFWCKKASSRLSTCRSRYCPLRRCAYTCAGATTAFRIIGAPRWTRSLISSI